MKEIRVVLANKTVLTTGRKGPDFSPFRETPANLIKELTNTKPAPVFKYADNLNRAITLDELKTMLNLTDVEPKTEIKIEAPKDIVPPVEPTTPLNVDTMDENNNEIIPDAGNEEGTPEGTDINPDTSAAPIQNGNQGQKIKNGNGRR